MSEDILEKIKMVVDKATQAESENKVIPFVEPVDDSEIEENPLGDDVGQEDGLEDVEGLCYALRRRPGESPSLECWFKDNSLLAFSYSYLRQVRLNTTHDKLLLLFADGKVLVQGRGLYDIARGINERKITRIIEQHRDLDISVEDEPFIDGMAAEVEEIEGFE